MAAVQQQPQSGVMDREPALTTSAGVMFCTLLLNALVSYGLPITPDLRLLLVGVVGILSPVVGGVIIRLHVFSPATVNELQKGWTQMMSTQAHAEPAEPVIQADPKPPTSDDPPTHKIM